MTLSFVISKLCSIVLLSLSLKKKGKLQNNIFGFKRVIYFNPRNQNCMLCDLYLCLKPFLVIKSGRESYLIFFIRDLQIVGGHICYVCFMTILSSQKLIVEYRFWLQKGSNIIPDMIFDPRPRHSNCGWFHLLFLTHDHFIKKKAENVKYRFWLQKGSKIISDMFF